MCTFSIDCMHLFCMLFSSYGLGRVMEMWYIMIYYTLAFIIHDLYMQLL
jgi:hypothetical protein